jgi:hypothetical protein
MRIKITREGSLLSLVLDREINEDQANSVIALLKDETLTTAVDAKAARGACAICGHNRSDPFHDERSSGFHEYERGGMGVVVIDYDAPSGAGDSVEAYRG